MDRRARDEQWGLALSDAGLDAAACRRYDFGTNEVSDAVGAVWFPPGEVLELTEHFPAAEFLEDANDPAHRSLHRVGVWQDTRTAVVGARMRHELEHAVQWERFGAGLFYLYDLVQSLLAVKAAGLDGCAGMYLNAIPCEQDANAAAAMFLRRHHTDTIDALCGDEGSRQLSCSLVGPETIETLPARMIAYIWLYRDICVAVMEEQKHSIDELLDANFPGAGEYWRRIDAGLLAPRATGLDPLLASG
jgi:hypothetical protein